jgi:two-component system, NarL family, invasion response regulator UvrY
MKILLADDHAMIRQGIVLLLQPHFPNATITECSNTDELETLLATQQFNIVITDLYMPGKPLYQLIKEQKQAGNNTPFIVLSMSLPERNAVRILKAGAHAYITKDTAPEDLHQAIQLALQGKKFITADIANLLADAFMNDPEKNLHDTLSERELQVFKLLAVGKTLSEIAQSTTLSINTISTYKSRIMEKMNFTSFADLVKYAHNNGFINA